MKTIGPPSTQVRKLNAVASGTLPNGVAVVVNADGTVSAIEETPVTQALGTAAFLSSANTEVRKMTSIYDPYSNTVVVFYSIASGLYAQTCTISGSTVTPAFTTLIHATPGTLFVGAVTATLTAKSSGAGFPQYIFVAFTEANTAGGNSVTRARLVYVSGTTPIGVGSVSLLSSQNQGEYDLYLTSAYDPVVDRVVVAFKEQTSRGKAFLVTIINNSYFSAGALIYLGTGTSQTNIRLIYETASGKVIASFTNDQNSYGVVQPLTAGLTTLTAGTITVFSSIQTSRIKTVQHTGQKEIVLTYSRPNAGVAEGVCIVGTSQAGGGFSFGTAGVFTASTTRLRLAYHSASEKIGITSLNPNTNTSEFYIATLLNRTFSFTGPDTYVSSQNSETNIVDDPTAEKLVLIYSGNNINPTTGGAATVGRTIQVAYNSTNLTRENYIGISKGEYSDADVATIDVQGAIHTVDLDYITSFAVTVADPGSGNRYYIDGKLQATIALSEGKTYRLDQSDASNGGHPLRFSTTSNGTHAGGVEYTTGVTVVGTPGSAGAYTQITVALSSPNLYYYCQIHSLMGGQATTRGKGILDPGESYFVQTDGTLRSNNVGIFNVFAGTACETTKLIVKG